MKISGARLRTTIGLRRKKKLQNQLDKFPQTKEAEVATNICQGVSYDEILKEGKEKEIDLIVIASLGRTGIAKYLMAAWLVMSSGVLNALCCSK